MLYQKVQFKSCINHVKAPAIELIPSKTADLNPTLLKMNPSTRTSWGPSKNYQKLQINKLIVNMKSHRYYR